MTRRASQREAASGEGNRCEVYGVYSGTVRALVEVAAGTGVVTRALRNALPGAVRIVATDLNEGRLKVAASRVAAPGVSFQPADAHRLPFADGDSASSVTVPLYGRQAQ